MVGALCAAAAALLVVSGIGKLRSPDPAARMIAALISVPRRRRGWLTAGVCVIGCVEIATGASMLAVGGRGPAAAVAALYLVFTVVAIRLAATGERTACGCFGRADAPVGTAHVLLDIICLAAAVGAVLNPVGPAGGVLDGNTIAVITGLVQVILLAWLGYLSITALPALTVARRELEVR